MTILGCSITELAASFKPMASKLETKSQRNVLCLHVNPHMCRCLALFQDLIFLLSAEVFVLIDGNVYFNFGIISKNSKCSYLLCLLNWYAADRVKQVELKSSLREVESVQDVSCH